MKWFRGKFTAAILILIAGMLTACGRPDTDSHASGEKDAHESAAEGQTSDTEEYLCQATVQIRGAKYLGSGVIWAEEEGYLVIATAGHVAADNEPMSVQFTWGEPLTAELIAVEEQVDLAFLKVDSGQVQEQEIPWQAARQDQKVCDALTAGDALLIMGSIEEAADRIYRGSVTESWIYLEDFDNYMLLGHAYAIPGVSGGGVFTADGILAGILCGGNDADEIAVLPCSVIEASYGTVIASAPGAG